MDTMEINKIVGAIVGALLIYLGAQFFADALFDAGPAGGDYAYAIPIEEPEAVEAEEVDLVTLIAMADASRGERLFARCRACHAVDPGVNGTGPSMHAIVGRAIGASDGFNYSGALVATGETEWTVENLYAFIARPRDWAPGTSMSFVGIPNSGDRAAIIAYLETLGN